MQPNQVNAPFAMVIFGATGDLTQRKLIPALFHLFQKDILPEYFNIVGFSRRNYSHADFHAFLKEALKKHYPHKLDEKVWEKFKRHVYYQKGEFHDRDGYDALIDLLKQFDDEIQACVPRFFYLATPPDKYSVILDYLHKTKLSEGCGQGSDKWTKILIEKPFGKSLEDAQKLDLKLAEFFKEEQIYRIDHYLGKETVQNILAFRFGNTIFDPVWNRQFIDHVQITIAETLGVETRGNFYEGIGALRDMAQSHLLELMATITMDRPHGFDAESIRAARVDTIKKIKSISKDQVNRVAVRGQYGISSKFKVQSSKLPLNYRDEANVDPKSDTETFVALKLENIARQWRGVPFYLRTGKHLAKKATEIRVIFKSPLHKVFPAPTDSADIVLNSTDRGDPKRSLKHLLGKGNVLTFNIESNEAIELTLNPKRVELTSLLKQLPLSYFYPKEPKIAEAYERLLVDAMRGEQMLFTRTDEVNASWQLITPIAEVWQKEKPDFPNYAPGSWGPETARELIERDGRSWLLK